MPCSRRHLFIAALGATSLPAWAQPTPARATPHLGAMSQRMGKAWLCLSAPRLARPARDVMASSQACFEQQLAELARTASGPEQAGSVRALARRYEDYLALLAGAPGPDAHRALLSTGNEVLTLSQLAKGPRDAQPWQARLASRQRLLSQRVALLGLASPSTPATRRERQAAIYEFEAGLQMLARTDDAALQEHLRLADIAWQPLKDGASQGRAEPVFVASEKLLTVLDAMTEHCVRAA